MLYDLRGGEIIGMSMYGNPGEALEAARLLK